jgi:Spy/CpxP family protein refolding chaperone
MIVHGRLPHYRHDLSPFGLGHVRIERTRFGDSLDLTEAGRQAIPEIRRVAREKARRAAVLRRKARRRS